MFGRKIKIFGGVIALGLPLGACHPMHHSGQFPSPSLMSCDSTALQTFVGRRADSQTKADLIKQAGQYRVRWLDPGDIIAGVRRGQEIEVQLTGEGLIADVACSSVM